MKQLLLFAVIILMLNPPVVSQNIPTRLNTIIPFPNGGFETNPAGGSGNWIWPASNWVWDSGVAHGGSHSARVSRSSGSATASIYSASLPVQPSTVYTMSYWLRTQDATFWPSVSIYQYKNATDQTGPRLIAHANTSGGTSSWYQVAYRFQTMPDAHSIQVRAYLPIATGTFWFDDFSLNEEGAAIYPYHAGFPVVANGSVFFSSPTVADINNDGANELLIAGGSSVNGWNQNGAALAGFPLNTNDKHIQSQLAVGDLDGNGDLEIAAGTKTPVNDGQGRAFVWHHDGTLLAGWPKSAAWNTQYGNNESLVGTVVFADIDGDLDLEILAGTSNNTAGYSGSNPPSAPNLYAWHANGSSVGGQWPTWQTTAAIYGCVAAGDLNGDGVADVEVGRDHHYLNVYNASGNSYPHWPVETYVAGNSGVYSRDEHIDYPHAAPVIADLDGDGEVEYIATGFVGGPGSIPYHNSALVVLEPDGSRRQGWETAALGSGLLNPEDLSIQAPAVADLDSDGQLEIISSTNDGWIRAYEADKSLIWSFDYTQGAVLVATEPAIGDINGDGSMEVLFGTRVPSRSDGVYYAGPVGLWALKADGSVMTGFPLPVPTPGMFGAPTLDDLDKDGKLEILVASREGEVLVWDTPTVYNPAQLPWPTGRHDLRRSGAYTPLTSLEASYKSALPQEAKYGETVTFKIHISSLNQVSEMVSMTDPIPTDVLIDPETLNATSGNVEIVGNEIRWRGFLPVTKTVDITYNVTVTTSDPMTIENAAYIDGGVNGKLTRSAAVLVNFFRLYLPGIRR